MYEEDLKKGIFMYEYLLARTYVYPVCNNKGPCSLGWPETRADEDDLELLVLSSVGIKGASHRYAALGTEVRVTT